MMPQTTTTTPMPPKPHNRRRILVVVLALMAVLVSAAITLVALRLATSDDPELASVSPSAKGIFEAYSQKGVGTIYDKKSYVQTPSSETFVYFKAAKQSYAVSTSTTLVSIYQAKSSTASPDRVYDKTKTFLNKLSLTETQSFAVSADSEQYHAFQNDETYCLLTSYRDYLIENDEVPTYRFACIEKSDADKVYEQTRQLLALHSPEQVSVFERVSISGEKMDGEDIFYRMLFMSSTNKTIILLYAHANGSDEYIGDLSQTEATQSKYNITSDVREKLSDPKYKGFLITSIIGADAE